MFVVPIYKYFYYLFDRCPRVKGLRFGFDFPDYLPHCHLNLEPRVQASSPGDDRREHLEDDSGGRARRRELRLRHNEFQQRYHGCYPKRQRLGRSRDHLHESAWFRRWSRDASSRSGSRIPRCGVSLRQGARRWPEKYGGRKRLRPRGLRSG